MPVSSAASVHRVEFIGAGPGHPDFLTLGGAAALRRCPSVLAPASYQRTFRDFLEGKEVSSPFQMDHAGVIAWIDAHLERGHVAFLIPGDFSSFCPFQSFVAHFGDRARVTPGVSAHAAASALLGKTFDLPGVAYATVLTSSRAFTPSGGRVQLRDYAAQGHTLVIYMNDLPLPELVAELKAGFGRDVPIVIFEKLSCQDERVTKASLDSICERIGDRDPFGIDAAGPDPALALVIAGDALAADEDPFWWDRRHERIWKPRGIR